jgi:uncharacterized protein
MRSTTFLVPMLALMLQASLAPARAQDNADERYLAITSISEVRAVPDRAVIQLGVETRAETAQAAMARNNEAMSKVVAALKSLAIPDENLQTSYINLSPIYSYPKPADPNQPSPPPVLVGFQATNSVSVELHDLTKVGPAIDAGITAGANTINGPSFRLADEQPFKLQALRQAATRARAKGDALAAGLGVTIDRVDSATEVEYQVIPVDRASPGAAPAPAADGVSTPVLPGELVVRAQVQVRFIFR